MSENMIFDNVLLTTRSAFDICYNDKKSSTTLENSNKYL